jgi:hypothetical protein
VPLKKAKPLDGLLRDRPALYGLPDPHPIRPGPGPEERLRGLQRRFRSVSKRDGRVNQLRRYYRSVKIAALAGVIGFAIVWSLGSSPWPVTTTLRHIASAPNCDFARLVGLAPETRRAGLLGASRPRRRWNCLRTMAAASEVDPASSRQDQTGKSPAHLQRFRPQRRTRRVRSARASGPRWRREIPEPKAVLLAMGGGRGA